MQSISHVTGFLGLVPRRAVHSPLHRTCSRAPGLYIGKVSYVKWRYSGHAILVKPRVPRVPRRETHELLSALGQAREQ